MFAYEKTRKPEKERSNRIVSKKGREAFRPNRGLDLGDKTAEKKGEVSYSSFQDIRLFRDYKTVPLQSSMWNGVVQRQMGKPEKMKSNVEAKLKILQYLEEVLDKRGIEYPEKLIPMTNDTQGKIETAVDNYLKVSKEEGNVLSRVTIFCDMLKEAETGDFDFYELKKDEETKKRGKRKGKKTGEFDSVAMASLRREGYRFEGERFEWMESLVTKEGSRAGIGADMIGELRKKSNLALAAYSQGLVAYYKKLGAHETGEEHEEGDKRYPILIFYREE